MKLLPLAVGFCLITFFSPKAFDKVVEYSYSNTTSRHFGNEEEGYRHHPIIFGHIHMAKTGGTFLNGLLANKYERICGHKGYTYNSYLDNQEAKKKVGPKGGSVPSTFRYTTKNFHEMDGIGYENCDWISNERWWNWWKDQFKGGKLHNVSVEIHVPCREPIEHLMSQCNHMKTKLPCDAANDNALFGAIKQCYTRLELEHRFDMQLEKQFAVKCYDFSMQFTNYTKYMSQFLQTRIFESSPYIKRETNLPRNKKDECIWERPELMQKVKQYLLKNIQYYKFCDKCIASENDLLGKRQGADA